MKIGGHGLREYLRLLAPLLSVIAAVWVLRMVIAMAKVPHDVVRLMSVTLAGSLSVLAAAFLIHFKRFGSYASVIGAAFLLVVYYQGLIVLAIVFATLTGTTNVFVAPEFGGRMTNTQHILGHLTFGVAANSILGAAMGCLILRMLRVFVPLKGGAQGTSGPPGSAASQGTPGRSGGNPSGL